MTPTIHTLKNYDKFSIINGNRNLNQKKIQKIITDINNGFNLLPYCPVIVYQKNDQFMIVDGQHRFEVSKQLGLEVHFVISNNFSLQQIAKMNSRQEKWSQKDFLSCYIKVGIEDYKTLRDVMSKYNLSINNSLNFLMHLDRHKKGSVEDFRNGDFKVNYYKETIELFDLHKTLFHRYAFYNDRNLIYALLKIKQKGLCDFEVLKEKLNKVPMKMDRQTTYKNYIYNIEQIYNHQNIKRKTIY